MPKSISVSSIPSVAMVTAPLETEKWSEENDATPLLDVLASSPAIVTVLPVDEVSIPSPPDIASVSESRSIAMGQPVSVLISKSSAVTLESTYALMDC